MFFAGLLALLLYLLSTNVHVYLCPHFQEILSYYNSLDDACVKYKESYFDAFLYFALNAAFLAELLWRGKGKHKHPVLDKITQDKIGTYRLDLGKWMLRQVNDFPIQCPIFLTGCSCVPCYLYHVYSWFL